MLKRKRNELGNDSPKKSLLDINKDLIKYSIPSLAHAEGFYSINATRSMVALSNSCHTLHTLFKPELNKRGAKQLISYVLYPDETAKKIIQKIARTNPGLFFIPIEEITDHVKDLDGNHRIYEKWSAYQLLFLGDVDLLMCVKTYLDIYLDQQKQVGKDIHDHAFAHHQVLEKFPSGFEFAPSTDEFKMLLTALEKAITGDQQLRLTGKPNKETIDLVKKLREYFKQGVVNAGHPFNMNDMIHAHEVYDQNLKLWWSHPQHQHFFNFFSVNVIGLLERFITAPYLLRMLDGLKNHEKSLRRSFKLTNHALGSDLPTKDIAILPLDDSNPLYRLGDSVFINSNTGRYFSGDNSLGARLHRLGQAGNAWETIIKETQQFCQNLFHTNTNHYYDRV